MCLRTKKWGSYQESDRSLLIEFVGWKLDELVGEGCSIQSREGRGDV